MIDVFIALTFITKQTNLAKLHQLLLLRVDFNTGLNKRYSKFIQKRQKSIIEK